MPGGAPFAWPPVAVPGRLVATDEPFEPSPLFQGPCA
jgi:hypothetical protein